MSKTTLGQLAFWEAPRTGRTGEDLRRELLASFSAGAGDREGAARDTGMDLAAAAQELSSPGWHARADAALREYAEAYPEVWVDGLYQRMGLVDFWGALLPGGPWPSHPNAWASVWKRAKLAGVIDPKPVRYEPTQLPGKHHHSMPVYRSRLHQKESAA